MAKHIGTLLGLMGLLIFSVVPAITGIQLGYTRVAAQQPQCATPFDANASNSAVLTYPFNSTGFSWVVADYNLAPGACALYSYVLANTSTEAMSWYWVGDFGNVTGVEWWVIPASQLNLFFTSNHTEGYAVGPLGTNETTPFANPTKYSKWYVYAVNTNNKPAEFYFAAEGEMGPYDPLDAGEKWVTLTLVPGESYSLIYNYTNVNPFFLSAAANSSTLTWTFTYNGAVMYSASGINPNFSNYGQVMYNYNLSKGNYVFTITNTGSAPVYVAMDVFNDQLTGIYVVVNHQQTTTTTTSTTSTTTTTSSTSTISITSTTTTTSTSSASPVSPTPTPVAHSSIPTYIYIVVAVLVVVVAALAVLVLRKR